MREIKFKCLVNGGWRYFTFEEVVRGGCKDLVGERWCEYTGLEDKNGTEIYDGDVVRGKHGKSRVYPTRGFGVVHMGVILDRDGNEIGDTLGWVVQHLDLTIYSLYKLHNKCDVIGNVYDRHELIELDDVEA